MGLDLQYAAGDNQIRIRLNPTDMEVLEATAGEILRQDLDAAMDVPDFGVEVEIARDTLLTSLDNVLAYIQSDEFQPQYAYEFKSRFDENDDRYMTGGGSFSGFKINGEYHCIMAGLNSLILQKYIINEQGKGEVIETKDIRHLKRLPTDTLGDIIISKRKKTNSLLRLFKKLRDFVANQKAEVIKKNLG